MKLFVLTFIGVMLLNFTSLTFALFRLTNVECQDHDKPYATVQVCKLKLIKRSVAAMYLHVKLHQVPVSNVSINGELCKRANGYRPFLYNVSENFCRIMKNAKRYPYINIYLNLLAKYSNINHTCPYDHDIIVKRLTLEDDMFQMLPLPHGDYRLVIKTFVNNDLKVTVKIFATVSD